MSTAREILCSSATIAQKVRELVTHAGPWLRNEEDLQGRVAEIGEYLERWSERIEPEIEMAIEDGMSTLHARLHGGLSDGLTAIVGDLHGDYPALAEILRTLYPADLPDDVAKCRQVVLLGDLLDRGRRDFQVLHLVVLLKELLGRRLVLLRGNHEDLSFHDERMDSSVDASTSYVFAVAYRRYLDPLFQREFVGFLNRLPVIATLCFERGSIALLHGGVPPAFLLRQAPTLDQALAIENVRKALLWGRMVTDRPRPERPYPYSTFFPADVIDFCKMNDFALVVRGHDTRARGFESQVDGRLLTVFSSGRSPTVENVDTAYGKQVLLPRFLVLDNARMFLERRTEGEHAGLDAGIAVAEVFQRDILFTVRDHDDPERPCTDLLQIVDHVRDVLATRRAMPIHVRVIPSGANASAASAPAKLLAPAEDAFDASPDPDRHISRIEFAIERRRGAITLTRVPTVPEDRGVRKRGGLRFEAWHRFLERCADHVMRAIDVDNRELERRPDDDES